MHVVGIQQSKECSSCHQTNKHNKYERRINTTHKHYPHICWDLRFDHFVFFLSPHISSTRTHTHTNTHTHTHTHTDHHTYRYIYIYTYVIYIIHIYKTHMHDT